MVVTFLNKTKFNKLGHGSIFNAGFGLGRNVDRVIKADGNIYLRLSPLADSEVYSGISQIIAYDRIVTEIENIVGR